MKILSLNIRVLGAVPKKLALKQLITIMSPTVLLLEETITEGSKGKINSERVYKGLGNDKQ